MTKISTSGDDMMSIKQLTMVVTLLSMLVSVSAWSATKEEIDTDVEAALAEFYEKSLPGKALSEKASGILVFPSVIKAGLGVGGEYGEGALLINGKAVEYYSTAGASVGLQFGAQQKSQVILFMNEDVLKQFRESKGWEAGVDGSIAVAEIGAGGEISSNTAKQPIIGFIFSNKGFMANLTLEGSKMTKIVR
jgi:lipid-binding SYLF domain-containing protein